MTSDVFRLKDEESKSTATQQKLREQIILLEKVGIECVMFLEIMIYECDFAGCISIEVTEIVQGLFSVALASS